MLTKTVTILAINAPHETIPEGQPQDVNLSNKSINYVMS